MITNILFTTLFACSVVTSAPINNFDYQKHNAVNENAFVLDDENCFVKDENVFYRYNALINQPIPNGMEELIDALYMIPRPPAGKSLIDFKTNSSNLSQYVGRWYNIYKYFDDDNNANYSILIQKNDMTFTNVDAYTLIYEPSLRPSQWYAMRFYENIDYETHKHMFNSMTDRNGNELYRDFKPIIELGILNYRFEYNFNNAFEIKYSYPSDDIYYGDLNSLYFDYQSINILETNGTETLNSITYENYYSDELDKLSAYYPNGDANTWFDFTDVYYVSIGSMLFDFFENYIFLKPNENYKNDLYLDLEKYFYYASNYNSVEFDEIDITYIYDDMQFNVIDIYIERGSNTSMILTIALKDTTKNLIFTLVDYADAYDWDSFLNYLNQNNIPKELLLKIDTSLNSGSFNFIRSLNIIQISDENNSDIGIFNIFDLLSGGLMGLTGIMSIMILPGITLGMLLMLPLLALLLFFIISLFKR